jgi:EAL domain-containing protein (putative c-di-GMP-specific phosphodiesterase class I)
MQRLSEALEHKEFELYFQPKANLINGDIVGFEALIRWQHPENGLLSPGEFLHFMDGSELEVLVGEWVIDSVLGQMAIWSSDGIECKVSANVSADHLLRDNFADRLRMILERHPEVAPERLELEILETAALADMKKAVDTITQCRKLGVQFALDDFGTGYSSLTYFLNLPVQLLKIDQSFVRVMLEDPGGLGIVESVVRLAQAFNRPVIAEGVETLEHGSMLLHFGCHLAQGYGISRPMPADQVGSWLHTWQMDRPWGSMVIPTMGKDVTLQVAAQSHRAWVDKVTRQVTHMDGEVVIESDSNTCSFGRWYRGSGVTRYGSAPEYKEIAVHHERSHQLAGQALTLALSGNSHDAKRVLKELCESRDNLLALVGKLTSKAIIWHPQ